MKKLLSFLVIISIFTASAAGPSFYVNAADTAETVEETPAEENGEDTGAAEEPAADETAVDETATDEPATEEPPTAEETVEKPQKTPKPIGWKKKKHSFYYLDAKNKPYKGIKKIGKRSYIFDKKGVQLTGWIKRSGNYYFCKIANGKAGYMVTGKTINGIALKKDGTAKATSANKAKLELLVKAQDVVRKATRPDDSKSEKLQKVFNYTISHYRYQGSPTFSYSADWDVRYATYMMTQGHGSCFHYGATFAYLGNAVGYKARAVSSGGHGWAEVDGKITDPAWQKVDGKRHSYYQIDPSLSGKDGRPGYARARKYVKKI